MTDLEQARYAAMRWNTPLSQAHAALLLDRLDVRRGARVLDLGCGWGELLLRAVATGGPSATGIGVDTDTTLLERGRALAVDRDLADRVEFVDGESAGWAAAHEGAGSAGLGGAAADRAQGAAAGRAVDRVLCVGASHAWAGPAEALVALGRLVPHGGRALFGEGCWERPPTPAAAAIFDEVLPLADLVAAAGATGWRVLHLSTSDQREWDDFEATWRRGRQEWLLANPRDERAAEVRDTLDTQLREYVEVYRGVLGFAYLVLGR